MEAVIATDAPVMVFDLRTWSPIDEVLRMDGAILPADRQVPLLDSHDRSTVGKQLGSTRELRFEGGNLVGRNYLSADPDSDHAWSLIEGGHLRDNSVSYEVLEGVTIERGKTATVKGRAYTAGQERNLRITTKWRIKENSLCPIGADGKAKNRADMEPAPENFYRKGYEMDFKEWLKKRGLEYDKLDEGQRAVLKVLFDNEAGRMQVAADKDDAADDSKDLDEVRAQAREDERARADSIRREGNALPDIPTSLIDESIRTGATLQDFRNKCLTHIKEKNRNAAKHAPAIHTRANQITEQILTDGLLMRAGSVFSEIVTSAPDGDRRAEMANCVRNISLVDLCRFALQCAGHEVPMNRDETIRAAFATASLTTILSNVAGKSLMRGYDMAPVTWREWCSTGSAPDYKTITRTRMTAVGSLKKTPSDAEVKLGSAVDEAETYNLDRYALRFMVDDMTIINDDLGAITKIPQDFGRTAANGISDILYEHFMSNPTMVSDSAALFVAATHFNLNTTCPLNATNLAVALAAFRKQTNKDKKPINMVAKYLIVPPDLEFAADVLCDSPDMIVIGVGSTAAKDGSINPFKRRKLTVVPEPRLSNSTFTNNSTTTWYLSADPNQFETVEVSFLNGRESPVLEPLQSDPSRFGVGWRVRADFGVKALDWRSVAKCTA